VKRFLITGGTGFIGRALAARLAAIHGASQVLAVGREFDLEDSARADQLFASHGRFDYIVHLADVQGNAAWSAAHSGSQFMRNTAISWNVLRCWKAHQADARLVTASSLWAYPEAVAIADEDHYWSGRMHVPTEHYGLAKKIIGMGIEGHKREYGMHGTTLVFGSVYGPGDRSTHVVPSLIRRMAESPARLDVLGDGNELRQFIYIDDQIEGIIRHLDYNGDLLNVVGGRARSIADVVRILVTRVGYSGKVVFGPAPSGTNRILDSRRAERVSGWPSDVSFVSLEEGLARTVASLTSARG
jgi:nucleoside-diphosphate-sugar epimerase